MGDVAIRPKRPPRPEGQWALGYREPLTRQERVKRDQDGLDVYDRIVSVYAKSGFDSIDPADLQNRFRWWGLYTQLPEEEGRFMMRLRLPGGQLTADQVDACAAVARRYGQGVVDVTDRQNFQFHNFRIEDIPAVWARLAEVGLSSLETCGDVTRNILGCPTAGIDADEILDATPYLQAVDRRLTGTKEFSNLPRKYKMSITGCTHQCAAHEINDVGLVGHRVEGRVGFDMFVGGGLSTNPYLAQRLGVFVLPEDVVEVGWAITSLFRDYGYRRSRTKARLKFLVADWGAQKVREVMEEKYLHGRLLDGPPAPVSAAVHRDHIGVHRQHDGNLYVGFPLVAGRTEADQLSGIAALARQYGQGRIRTTTQQKMVILDIPEDRVHQLVAGLASIGLQVRPSSFRRSTMACTGLEFCKLALAETKGLAATVVDELERRLPDFDDYARINLNGCPNSCARFQVADIGFMGSMVVIDGVETDVFQVHLGGHLGIESRFGRKVKGARIRADRLPDFLESLLRAYLARRQPGQDFTAFLNSFDDEGLQVLAQVATPEGALVPAGSSEGTAATRATGEESEALVGSGSQPRRRGQR
ncbi:MAG TPA: nitrite/sulfite reductase [Candidatus Eisenbacteria bacterium]|nr:nitrite/sulfite reductase [Candidatus Eisenbacteria bacterium]